MINWFEHVPGKMKQVLQSTMVLQDFQPAVGLSCSSNLKKLLSFRGYFYCQEQNAFENGEYNRADRATIQKMRQGG